MTLVNLVLSFSFLVYVASKIMFRGESLSEKIFPDTDRFICLVACKVALMCLLFQMVTLLMFRGANVNANDKKYRRPIHYAAFMGTA